MKTAKIFLLTALLALMPKPGWAAPGEHDHAHDHGEPQNSTVEQAQHQGHEHDEEHDHGKEHDHGEEHGHDDGQTRIAPAIAQQAGIASATAGPGRIRRTITVYGKVVTSQEQISHIRARFPGLIAAVKAKLGDRVAAGDVLAEIESNESLKKYPVRAPITGVIIARHANIGEFTGDQVLFSLASFDPLWAELKIFPSQRDLVKPGLPVRLVAERLQQDTQVRHVFPGDDELPFVVARVEITNRDGHWVPGILTQGEIAVEEVAVPLVIDNRALQTYAGKPVVFVRDGERFAARAVRVGRSDYHHSEVIAGLSAGEIYVVENSYLIKADLEKAAAEHHH